MLKFLLKLQLRIQSTFLRRECILVSIMSFVISEVSKRDRSENSHSQVLPAKEG